MNCPSCNTSLTMSERSGVEIDFCPQCRGVWLDRGELDKIIERAAAFDPRRETQVYEQRYENPQRKYDSGGYRKFDDDDYENKKHKRNSFLGELFDF